MRYAKGYRKLRPKGVMRAMAIVLLLLVQSFGSRVSCQCTTQGDDFWVMFLENYGRLDDTLTLIATGNSNAVITVENPATNWVTTANLVAGNHVVISIPNTVVNTNIINGVTNMGLHVTSTADITLFASNYMFASYDVATILPTSVLDTHYIAQDYNYMFSNSYSRHDLGVLAIYDTTVVTICNVIQVVLMKGQTYQVASLTTLSGTEVFSNEPIAMFQGNECVNIPDTSVACDHIYEQAVPVKYWGTDFVAVPSDGRSGDGDFIRITSSQNNCDITIDGVVAASNLMKGATYQTNLPFSRAKRIQTTKPCCVGLYLSSMIYGGDPGDPASVIISPMRLGTYDFSFAAFNTYLTTRHYVNIATRTRFVSGMTLDGNSIASSFAPVDSVYSFARLRVQQGVHNLHCVGGYFVAHYYGLGYAESYAAGTGFNFCELLQINEQPVRYITDTVSICVHDTAFIELYMDASDTSVCWFIDGNPLNDSALFFRHHFDSARCYTVMAVTHGLCDTVWCDTLYGVVRTVIPGVDTVHLPVCENEPFTYRGASFTGPGTYRVDVSGVCDSLIYIVAYLNDTLRDTMRMDICEGDTALINGDTLYESGLYHWELMSYWGCDSVSYINLIVHDTTHYTIFDTICENESYRFAGRILTSPGVYYDTTYVYGCENLTVLVLENKHVAFPNILPDTEEVCLGTVISRIDTSVETQGNIYRWQWGDGDVSTSDNGDSVLHLYSEPGLYRVLCEISAPNGCVDTSYLLIEVYDYTRADLSVDPPNIITLPNPNIVFHNLSHPHNTQYNTYLWEFIGDSAESVTSFFCFEPVYKDGIFAYNGGNYLIRLIAYTTYTKHDGTQLVCTDTSAIAVVVNNDFLQFPNVITPNGDGLNDIFAIKNLIEGKEFTDTELYIYNHWGRKVYYKRNISKREDFWDPSVNHDPSGTYYYRFSANGYRGNVQRNGVVQVLQ